jgi:hypothetical protein
MLAEATFGPLFWLELDAGEQKRLHENNRKRDGFSYKRFPQESGRIVYVHNKYDMGGAPLPVHKHEELFALVESWAMSPEGKNISGTMGFGRHWQGTA